MCDIADICVKEWHIGLHLQELNVDLRDTCATNRHICNANTSKWCHYQSSSAMKMNKNQIHWYRLYTNLPVLKPIFGTYGTYGQHRFSNYNYDANQKQITQKTLKNWYNIILTDDPCQKYTHHYRCSTLRIHKTASSNAHNQGVLDLCILPRSHILQACFMLTSSKYAIMGSYVTSILTVGQILAPK